MSLPNLSVKIILGEEIRKLNRLPKNWLQLENSLQGLFGTTEFNVTYLDEEGDLITMSNTEELLDTYQRFASLPSLKLIIKEKPPIQVTDQIVSFSSFQIPNYPHQKSTPQINFQTANEKLQPQLFINSRFISIENQPKLNQELKRCQNSKCSCVQCTCTNCHCGEGERTCSNPYCTCVGCVSENCKCSPTFCIECFDQHCQGPKPDCCEPEQACCKPEQACQEPPQILETSCCNIDDPCCQPEQPCCKPKRPRRKAKGRYGQRKEKLIKSIFNHPSFEELLKQKMKEIFFDLNEENAIQAPEIIKEEQTVHQGVTCDGCGVSPIRGIRYKCFECPDFDFCEACEASKPHSHSFIKIKEPKIVPEKPRWRANCVQKPCGPCRPLRGQGRGPEQFFKNILKSAQGTDIPNIIKDIKKNFKKGRKPFKAKTIELMTLKNNQVISVDQPYTMVWKVKNNGSKAWPDNSKLKFVKGNINTNEEVEVTQIQVGENTEIQALFSAPQEGVAQGVWKLMGDNVSFGKFKVKTQAVNVSLENLEKVKQLMKMGFNIEQAKQGLKEAQGNLEIAVSMIFKSIQ